MRKPKPKRKSILLMYRPSTHPFAIPMTNSGKSASWRHHLLDANRLVDSRPIKVNMTLYDTRPVQTIANPTRRRIVNAILSAVQNEPGLNRLVLHSLLYDDKRKVFTIGFNS